MAIKANVSLTSHLAPRKSHLASLTWHLAPRTSQLAFRISHVGYSLASRRSHVASTPP